MPVTGTVTELVQGDYVGAERTALSLPLLVAPLAVRFGEMHRSCSLDNILSTALAGAGHHVVAVTWGTTANK